MMINIKRAVSDNREVWFKFYRENELWYETDFGEVFPVPISDTDRATFLPKDKALLFMRWMRKWNEGLE